MCCKFNIIIPEIVPETHEKVIDVEDSWGLSQKNFNSSEEFRCDRIYPGFYLLQPFFNFNSVIIQCKFDFY